MRRYAAVLLLLFARGAGAVEYYIDNAGGDDANPGTSPGAALRTIQAAITLSSSGVADRFLIRNTGSTYAEDVMVWKSGLDAAHRDVYEPWPGDVERPTIKRIFLSKASGNQPTYLLFRRLKFYPGARAGVDTIGCNGGSYVAHHMTFEECDIRGGYDVNAINFWASGPATPNYDDLTLRNCVIHGRGGDAKSVALVQILKNAGTLSLNRCTIEGCTIYYEPGEALRAGMLVELDASAADGLTVRDNELTCNHASTLGHADRDALRADAGTGSLVFNNRVRDTGQSGLRLNVAAGAAGVAVKNNLVLQTSQSAAEGGGLVLELGAGAHVRVEFNTILESALDGVVLAGDTASALVSLEHNIIVNHSWSGILLAAAVAIVEDYNCFSGNLNGDISDGRFPGWNDVLADPGLVDGHFLDQEWSPCVDAGRDTAAAAGLGGWSTAADGRADLGRADLGYHHAPAAALPAAGWGLF